MIKGKKVAIFDMDGTLINSVGIWNEVDRKLIQTAGNIDIHTKEAQEQRDRVLRKFNHVRNPYMEYCGHLKEKYEIPLTIDEIIALRYQIATDLLTHKVDYKKNAVKVLKLLKRNGFTLIIATTTGKSNMEIYRTKNQNIISKGYLDDFFTAIYTREDVKEIKPSPEIHLRILKDFAASPEECIIFEDSLVGVEAARKAGIESIVIHDEHSDHERDQINNISDYQFNDFDEILMVLQTELESPSK